MTDKKLSFSKDTLNLIVSSYDNVVNAFQINKGKQVRFLTNLDLAESFIVTSRQFARLRDEDQTDEKYEQKIDAKFVQHALAFLTNLCNTGLREVNDLTVPFYQASQWILVARARNELGQFLQKSQEAKKEA